MELSLQNPKLNNQIGEDSFVGKTILVVNTGPIEKKFIFQRLKKLGLTVVVLHREKNWIAPYVDHWIIADTYNHSESTKSVGAFIKDNPSVQIDGVVTFWEDDVLLTSKIVDKYDFIGTPFNIAKNARNKYLFREFCNGSDITAPRHRLVKNGDDLDFVAQNFSFPLVLKPAYGSRSAFVMKVTDPVDLKSSYAFVKKSLSPETESALNDGSDIFIEEYVDGDEVDIDILLQHGKIKFACVSDNYSKDRGEFFLDSGQATPSTLPESTRAALVETAEETLEKLGIQNGCIHFEAKFSKNGPIPLDINLRLGGDYVYSYIKDAWGVDLIEGAVKIAIGQYIPVVKMIKPKQYIIGWDLYPETSGLLVELTINDELKNKPYFEEIHLYKEVGDPVLLPPEGYEDSMGWVTVSGENYLDAQNNLREALKLINFRVAGFNAGSALGKTQRKTRYSSAVLNKSILLQASKFERIKRKAKDNLRDLHIGVACNNNENSTNPVDSDLTSVGMNIMKTLKERGYKVTFFDFNDVFEAIKQLKDSNVDMVFNVCERINNSSLLEPHAAAILDALNIPYTGSNPNTLGLCIDKIKVKKLLDYHDIPTPNWDYVYFAEDEIDPDLRYPMIVKPASTDNSIGITNDSVVTDEAHLREQIKKCLEISSAALIEEFIEGDEYDASVIGNDDELRVLPLTRSIFKDMPEGYWHIYPFASKWEEGNAYDKIITQSPPKNISKKLESLISEIALDTYNILDCHDYGRVELRVDADDNPYVLELNPNPSINIEDSTPAAAELVGMNYGEFLEEMIRLAITRYKDRPPYHHLQTNIL
ncbi:MAG: ATP-grasp domain-containing protein [Candidatus Magasanikbacteria bacterium]|jgi:D-alanine-D-alanine ligase